MPWSIKQSDGKYCVVKDDGETVKCHETRADAIKHQRALYANESMAASMQTLADGALSEEQIASGTLGTAELAQTYASSMTAALAPLKPPKEWFDAPEADGPTPLTYTDEGQVFGHLALWGSCHTGFLNGAFAECVKPPRSATDYSYFHLGEIETKEGDSVPIGKLTYDTSHAPLSAGLQAATSHYDETGSVGAFVRARDGEHGIWLAGAVRSNLAPEGLRDLRANPLSGDWRSLNHSLELVASLAVVVPGFPIPRAQLALAASGQEQEVSALILPGFAEPEIEQEIGRDHLRRRKVLSIRTRRALIAAGVLVEG